MILFKQEHVEPILMDLKIQTRRLGKLRWKVGSVRQAKTGYRKDMEFARLVITGIRQERLGDISPEDAIKEGYPTISAYIEAFIRIYGSWDPDRQVWVVDFERVKEG